MLYVDFDWDVSPKGIMLDDEFKLDKLGWKNGDYFKVVVHENGKKFLLKVDTVEEFIIKGVDNGSSNND